MIDLDIKEALGTNFDFLDDEKTLAAIYPSFYFEDGDSVPVYIEEVDGRMRFCDQGGVTWQFMARGVRLDEPGQLKFIEELARPTGVVLNDDAELELWIDQDNIAASYTRFMCAMLALVRWEYLYVAEQEASRRAADIESATLTPINA